MLGYSALKKLSTCSSTLAKSTLSRLFSNITGLWHFGIIVDDIESATKFYQKLLDTKPIQHLHVKNIGLAKSLGFMKTPEEVDLSIRFLAIPNAITLELIEYHNPKGKTIINKSIKPNDIGGVHKSNRTKFKYYN